MRKAERAVWSEYHNRTLVTNAQSLGFSGNHPLLRALRFYVKYLVVNQQLLLNLKPIARLW